MVSDPTTFEEAVAKKEWRQAMKEELLSIEKNSIWELADLPNRKNPIVVKWIFKTKFQANGSIQKYKA